MSPAILILIYCLFVVLASLAGGWLPSLIELTHVRKQLTMSLVSGVMLGVALLHMLPHSVQYLPSIAWVGGSMLCGVLVMFFLLRVFHVHAHDSAEDHHHEPGQFERGLEHGHGEHKHDEHDHAEHGPGEHSPHEHGHQDREQGGQVEVRDHHLSWAGLFVGLTIHSLLDGVAMAASVVAEASHGHAVATLLGLSTFLAVVLHKPLDALAITSLMRTTDWTNRGRNLVNGLFALSCPLGAVLFLIGASRMTAGQNTLVGAALAFSAGFFLCIALSDLLPEVAFHSHDRIKLSVALLLGVAISIAIEMTHSHESHAPDSHHPADVHQHGEADHDHSEHDHSTHDHSTHDHSAHDGAGHDQPGP